MGRFAVIAICMLTLAACGKTSVQLVAECELDGERLYAPTVEERDQLIDNHIAICMAAEGYEVVPSRCPMLHAPSCYRRARFSLYQWFGDH
jgi:hypothetical protein